MHSPQTLRPDAVRDASRLEVLVCIDLVAVIWGVFKIIAWNQGAFDFPGQGHWMLFDGNRMLSLAFGLVRLFSYPVNAPSRRWVICAVLVATLVAPINSSVCLGGSSIENDFKLNFSIIFFSCTLHFHRKLLSSNSLLSKVSRKPAHWSSPTINGSEL